jgi:hypothetical protein
MSDVANNADVRIDRFLGSDTTMHQRVDGVGRTGWNRRYLRPSNYGYGDIRVFVAFGSPFEGSPLAWAGAILASDKVRFRDPRPQPHGEPLSLREFMQTAWTTRTELPARYSQPPAAVAFAAEEHLADTLRRRFAHYLGAIRVDANSNGEIEAGQPIGAYNFHFVEDRNVYEDMATLEGNRERSILRAMQLANYHGMTRSYAVATYAGKVGLDKDLGTDIDGEAEAHLLAKTIRDHVHSVEDVADVAEFLQRALVDRAHSLSGSYGDGIVPLFSQMNVAEETPLETLLSLPGNAVRGELRQSRLMETVRATPAHVYQLNSTELADYIFNVLDGVEAGHQIDLR